MAYDSEPSETFPNNANGHAAANGSPRTMADITRLFMAGAPPATARPVRKPPQRDLPQVPPIPTQVTPRSAPVHMPAAPADTAPEPRAGALPVVQVALTEQLGPGGFGAVVESARLLASQHRTAIGVIGRDGDLLQLVRLDDAPSGFVASTFTSQTAALDVQVARSLFAMRDSVRHWIVALPRDAEAAMVLLESCPDWLMIAGTDNDAVVAAYRTLKNACAAAEPEGRRVRLMLRTADRAEAARVHARLNHVADGFLGEELTLVAPTHPARAGVEHAGRFALPGVPADVIAQAWMSVCDFMQELMGRSAEGDAEEPAAVAAEDEGVEQVLNDEERTALGAAFGAWRETAPAAVAPGPVAAAVAEAPAVRPALAVPVAAPVAASPRAAGPVLQAVETQGAVLGRMGLWETVRQSVGGLQGGATVLEAQAPIEEASLLAVDSCGRLNVWMLADAENPAGWGALWQWALDHRKLIALASRDVRVDVAAEPRLHVVLPPEMIHAPVQGARGQVRWYRLCPIQWGDKRGMVVTPAN